MSPSSLARLTFRFSAPLKSTGALPHPQPSISLNSIQSSIVSFQTLIRRGVNLFKRFGSDSNSVLSLILQNLINRQSYSSSTAWADYLFETVIPEVFAKANIPLTKESMSDLLTVRKEGKQMPLLISRPEINPAMLERLLNCRHLHLDIHATDSEGRTLLHVAESSSTVASLIVRKGVVNICCH